MKKGVDFDVAVIGGGIIGLASAYKIVLNHPNIRMAVLEKEEQLAMHQTGHNSGVIHSGLYYKPGSNKAKTCAKGRSELVAFAKKYKIPCKISGKIIVATGEKELPNLEKLFENGLKNNIEGIEKIGPDQIREIEPFCQGIAGIRVPCTGIIDFVEVAKKLGSLIEAKGSDNKILTSHEVLALDKHDFYTRIVTNNGTLNASYIINCAGLASDRIAWMDNIDPGVRIVPFRGDYHQLTEQAAEKVKSLIYPVPDPAFPFLGVHFARTIDGLVKCGPNAVLSFKREGYGKADFSMRDTWESLSYWGTWRLFRRHFVYGLGEYTRAFSRRLLLRRLRRLIPSLEPGDLTPGPSGVRAQALGRNGELIDDFKIEKKANSIHVLNASSPAATASLAIGDYINEIATVHFNLR